MCVLPVCLLSRPLTRPACCTPVGSSAPHLLQQQASAVLLAAVSALSLHNIAGGQEVPPAAMADLLRAQELKEQLDKCEAVGRVLGTHGACGVLGFDVVLGGWVKRDGGGSEAPPVWWGWGDVL